MNKDRKEELSNLYDALVDDIGSRSDEEILLEINEDGVDMESYSSRMLAKLQDSLLETKKENLLKAQKSVEAEKKKRKAKKPLRFKPGEAKSRVNKILFHSDQNYTLAARSGNNDEMSEKDAHSLLEDDRDLNELNDEEDP